MPPIARAKHGPRLKGTEPTGAGDTRMEEDDAGTHGDDGGTGGAIIMGQRVTLYGKAEDPPPAHVTSVTPAAAGNPKMAEPGSLVWHALKKEPQDALQSCQSMSHEDSRIWFRSKCSSDKVGRFQST